LHVDPSALKVTIFLADALQDHECPRCLPYLQDWSDAWDNTEVRTIDLHGFHVKFQFLGEAIFLFDGLLGAAT
jgi:hypothetical protein